MARSNSFRLTGQTIQIDSWRKEMKNRALGRVRSVGNATENAKGTDLDKVLSLVKFLKRRSALERPQQICEVRHALR